MGLFEQILGAIDNPEQEASTDKVGNILDTVQQLSGAYQTNPGAVTSAMSLVGNYVKGSLQQKREVEGEQQVTELINNFAGTQASNQIVKMLFTTPQMEQLLTEVENRTGINQQTIMAMLPTLVPLVLNVLKMGNKMGLTSNPILTRFLDADGDGDVDMADFMQMASRYFSK